MAAREAFTGSLIPLRDAPEVRRDGPACSRNALDVPEAPPPGCPNDHERCPNDAGAFPNELEAIRQDAAGVRQDGEEVRLETEGVRLGRETIRLGEESIRQDQGPFRSVAARVRQDGAPFGWECLDSRQAAEPFRWDAPGSMSRTELSTHFAVFFIICAAFIRGRRLGQMYVHSPHSMHADTPKRSAISPSPRCAASSTPAG